MFDPHRCLPLYLVRKLLLSRNMLLETMPQLLDRRNKEGHIMLWAIAIVGTYVAGIYLIRLVWWQE